MTRADRSREVTPLLTLRSVSLLLLAASAVHFAACGDAVDTTPATPDAGADASRLDASSFPPDGGARAEAGDATSDGSAADGQAPETPGTCDSGPTPRGPLPPGTPIVYPAATGSGALPLFADFAVTVGGKASPVYTAYVEVDPGTKSTIGFTNFDVDGSTSVVLTVNGRSFTTAQLLPSAYAVTPSVSGAQITIPIPRPGTYELLLDGQRDRSLMIFANPHEVSPPAPGASGVVYYAPGVHDIGDVAVQSNTTYYLSGGAIVHGTLRGSGVQNVTIRGRGILDNTSDAAFGGESVSFENSSGITVEGITIVDHLGTAGWMIPTRSSHGVLLDRVKIMSDRDNSDGIDVCDSFDVEIRNVFVRSHDDGITIKEFNGGNSHDICAHDSVIASDWGNACLIIGEESVTDEKYNIAFNNIDVIHPFCARPMSVWISGHAHAHDLYFGNVTIENNRAYDTILGIINAGGDYATPRDPQGAGSVTNVVFQNIQVLDDDLKASSFSADGGASFDGVHFKHVTHQGTVITNSSAMNLSVSSTTNVTFEP